MGMVRYRMLTESSKEVCNFFLDENVGEEEFEDWSSALAYGGRRGPESLL